MRTHSSKKKRSGFTLIEMLVTITIIVILAGLSLGGFKYIRAKQANAQAEIQIKLLERAIEEYKLDYGEYPSQDIGSSGSNSLYIELYYNGAQDPPVNDAKIYLSELDPENNKQGWTRGTGTTVTIVDPWENEYIYRNGSDPAAVNPDFDIVSYGKDGKTDTKGQKSKDDHNNF